MFTSHRVVKPGVPGDSVWRGALVAVTLAAEFFWNFFELKTNADGISEVSLANASVDIYCFSYSRKAVS